MKTIFFLLFTFFICSVNAQIIDTSRNLVPNPSFEEYIECPSFHKQLKNCKHWSIAIYSSSPDYFNSCFIDSLKSMYVLVDSNTNEFRFIDTIAKQLLIFPRPSIHVPQNDNGFQEPKTGNAYAGIITLDIIKTHREYIQTKLKHSLEKNKRYMVSMYVSLADSSMYANDRFRFCFTKNTSELKISQKRWHPYPQIECNGGILIKTDTLLSNTQEWVKVSGIYTAFGGEQFLTIGVLKNDMTGREYNKKIKNPLYFNKRYAYAYYYIDDVSVYEVLD